MNWNKNNILGEILSYVAVGFFIGFVSYIIYLYSLAN